MAKRKPYKNITIHPAQGGALIGSASDDVPITQESNYLSSSANYTDKVNFRRETDGELRREGWELFTPSGNSSDMWGNINSFDAINSQYPIRAIHQFPGTDGTPVLIAISGPNVWRLFSSADTYAKDYQNSSALYATNGQGEEYWVGAGEDFYWRQIYVFESFIDQTSQGDLVDPFEGGAYRWEIVDVQNHVIINNGVDLPIVYKSEYERAEPLYSLRENGVVSVGTIGEFQDRLFCADLTVITDGFDTWFQQASDPYKDILKDPLYGQVKVQRFQYRTVYSAEGEPKLFNSGVIVGASVVMESGGLPGTLSVSTTGSYSFTPDYNYAIDKQASMYKFLRNGTFQGEEAYTVNMVGAINAVKTVNEDPNSLIVSGIFLTPSTGSSNEYATDPSDPSALYVETGYYDEYGDLQLVDKDGSNLILIDPNTGNTLGTGNYSIVLRPYAEQLRSPAAFREFAQDGSRILKIKALADKLVVYRDSGFFFVSKTNSAEFPFAIEPRYTGGRVADFRHTIIDVDGKQHIFMGNSGIYSINRSSTEPQPVSMFEIGPPFWQLVPPDLAEYVYAVDNPITREIFINCPLGILQNEQGDLVNERNVVLFSEENFKYSISPDRKLYADDPTKIGDQPYFATESGGIDQRPRLDWGVIAYDYINKTLSTIDASFTSSSFIRKPKHNRVGPEEAWFIMGVHQVSTGAIYPGTQYREDSALGGVLCRYGYGPPKVGEREPYRVYSRLGYGYHSSIRSGLIDFGDSFSDKECRSYVIELSSKYGTTPTRVKISTTTAPQGTEQVETMQVVDGKELDYVELNNLKDENMIPLYIKAPYLRDEIIVLPEYEYSPTIAVEPGYIERQETFFDSALPLVKDNPIKIVGRTFEVSGVNTRSTTQAYNQG
jgi:hypothetical protein